MSNTGKSPKKGKGSGRPKKDKTPANIKREIWKEIIDKVPDEFLDDIIGWIKKPLENDKHKENEKLKKIIKTLSVSSRKLAITFGLSKSTICNIKNDNYSKRAKDLRKHSETSEYIYKIFYEHKKRCGREAIAQYLLRNYQIKLSGRQVGRYMNLKCIVKSGRKYLDAKNTKVIFPNIVNRDYNNTLTDKRIYAMDVPFFRATKDVTSNFVYLSTMIDHKTKMIISYKLSKFNDKQLGLDTIIKVNINNCIIHTDHRSQYSSIDFVKYLENNNAIQSMSRVSNSLDNREILHIKNELTHHIDTTKITFNDLSNLIDDYIEYYNKEWIQEKIRLINT